jgi:hypothetical protein
MFFVPDHTDPVAAGALRVIERDVGFREQFDDPPAVRAANQSGSDRGADLEAKTVPEQRAAQHHHGLLQHARDPRWIFRSAQDDREFVATEPADQAGIVEGPPQTLRDLA